MAPDVLEPLPFVPLLPEELLRKHHVHEPMDHRFRSAARLLQSLWREDRELPIGHYRIDGKRRKLGSRISHVAARAGANFMAPAITALVRRELAYREPAAMIDEGRLYGNLLSSMPLAFNLFGLLQARPCLRLPRPPRTLPRFEGRRGSGRAVRAFARPRQSGPHRRSQRLRRAPPLRKVERNQRLRRD
nr:hypothetical protein [Bosea sp. ASV33]